MANSKNITFDQLQNALTRVKGALDGKANTVHGNHVPKTETVNNAKFLRNDNTWQIITPVNIGAADRSHSHGSYVNQNAFTNIKVDNTTIAAGSATDTLTLAAGANVTLAPNADNNSVTISAKDTIYTHPTTSGNKHIPSGGSSGQILRWSADGTAAWGSDNNTDTKVTNTLNTTTKAYVTGTTSATTNTGTQVFDTGVYLDTTAGKLVATTFAGALSGNASTATSLQTARKFTIGNTERTFNGSGDVKWTLADIGAAAASHNHTSLTGVTKLQFAAGSSDSAVIKVTTEEANTYLDFEMNDDVNTDMYRWRFSAYESTGATPYFNLMTLTAKDASSARLTVNGDVTASSFTGNASSATKLQTARAIKIGNTSKNFDGSANVTWTLSEIGAAASAHSHSYLPLSGGTISKSEFSPLYIERSGSTNGSAIGFKNSNGTLGYIGMNNSANGGLLRWSADASAMYTVLDSSNYNTYAATKSHGTHVTYASAIPLVAGTASIGTSAKVAREDHVHPAQTSVSGSSGSCTGNAATATKLKTARNIALTGTITGNANFDGSGNISIATSVGNTPASGNWFKGVPVLTSAGVMEVGKYIDFHNAANSTTDYDVRLQCNGTSGNTVNMPTNSGTLALLSDNIASATKLQSARKLTIGDTGKSFNGTADVAWTLSDIGAAASNHSHNKITSRGRVTCESGITVRPAVDGLSMSEAYNNGYPTSYGNVISLRGTGDGQILVGWSGSDGAHAPVYVRSKRDNTTTADWSDWAQFYTSANPQPSVTGNAGTATKLATARTLTIGNTGKAFDGSGNVSWSLSEIGAAASSHTHSYIPLSGSASITGNLEFSNSGTTTRGIIGAIGDNDFWRIVGGATATNAGYLEIATADDANEPIYVRQYGSGKFGTLTRTATLLDGSGNTSFPGTVTAPTFKGSLNGNASTATKLQTARKINDIPFDGSADKTIPLKTFGSYVGDNNTKNYHRILSSGNVTGQYTDKSITLMASGDFDGGAYGIVRIILRTNSSTSNSVGKIEWIARKGFGLDSIVFNIKSTAGATIMDVFYKSPGTYACVTWTVLGEGGRDGRNGGSGGYGATWTKYNTHAVEVESYTADAMKTIASYTSTMNQGTDVAHVNTASKLNTARSINGTNFDGSGNITTANWGTARTLTVGNTGKSVNGSGNVSWSLAEIGALPLAGGTMTGAIKLNSAVISTDASAPTQLSYGLLGSYGNLKLLANTDNDAGANDEYVHIATARGLSPATDQGIVVYGTYANAFGSKIVTEASGNAPSATKLQTARTINGTSFNGTANITTANWGTTRTLTIGNTGKSVNGSGNVSWSLSEIGAAAKSHGNHVPATQAADNKKFLRNDNTWQTVTPANIGAAPSGHTHNQILDGNSNITITQANDRSGLDGKNNINLDSWYGVSISNGCSNAENYGQVTFSVDARNGNVWTRGTVNAPIFSGSLSGNASSATKLQTARAIKIGNTSRNFDGTGNVTWTLSDIGAAASNHSHSNYAASSHEHNYLNVKGTNTINSTANDTTANWGAQGNSVHWYAGVEGLLHDQPSSWGYLVNIGQSSEVHQVWMTQASGDLLHRGGNGSGWSGSWRTILDSSNYSTWAAAKSHTHDYAASNHTHNYAAANHNHDSAYLKLSGGTLSGSLTVNNNVYSQGFCVSKNGKEVWFDIGDSDTYIWASGANKSLQITHSGDLNFDGQPVLYGGRGNNYDTATSTIYFNNSGTSHKGRISCYNNTDGDYVQLALRTADATTNYMTVRTDTVNFGSAIVVQGHKVSIATSAPSSPSTGDVWINIG